MRFPKRYISRAQIESAGPGIVSSLCELDTRTGVKGPYYVAWLYTRSNLTMIFRLGLIYLDL